MHIILDAGIFISAAKGDRKNIALMETLRARTIALVPATTIAEFWRGGTQSAAEAHILRKWQPRIIPINEHIAKKAGTLLAITGQKNVLDAIVVATASEYKASEIYTSDPDDIEALLSADPKLHTILTIRV